MDISFASRKLKRQMEDEKAMQKAFGLRAKPLKLRLRALSQAPTLADVPRGKPDRCHLLTGDRGGQIAVRLTGNWRLVFVPDHDPVPLRPDGGIDFAAVTAVTIIEVVDYHGR
jgi:proteic killer suppression protein